MTHQVKLISTAVVLADAHVVLVKFKDMPDQQRGWFLPHDLLTDLEHPTDGAKRALREQVGIMPESIRLIDVESFRGRDKTWHMSFHHRCDLARRVQLTPSSQLAAAEWFALAKLPALEEVAHHGWALETIRKIIE